LFNIKRLKASLKGSFFMEKFAIVVAGGSGTRMGSDTPKQFLLLGAMPILIHTLSAFIKFPEKINIILVLPQSSFKEWEKIRKKYAFHFPIKIAQGGASRFESVKNGLAKINNHESLVAIHDGVRPLVTEKIIKESFDLAKEKGSAIASTPIKESIRELLSDKSIAIDRSKMRSIQTPQTFQTHLIKSAFDKFDIDLNFTDDASVAEKAGFEINLFEGSYQNIKITTPEDLLFAEAILSQKKSDK
jgi:2-C-methyl-D-erythritol 4-phosphate cytidylyltransferase